MADQGKETWSDREGDEMVLWSCFCLVGWFFCVHGTMGTSVGVYTLLGLSLYLDLVSCAVPYASVFGVHFDPF